MSGPKSDPGSSGDPSPAPQVPVTPPRGHKPPPAPQRWGRSCATAPIFSVTGTLPSPRRAQAVPNGRRTPSGISQASPWGRIPPGRAPLPPKTPKPQTQLPARPAGSPPPPARCGTDAVMQTEALQPHQIYAEISRLRHLALIQTVICLCKSEP